MALDDMWPEIIVKKHKVQERILGDMRIGQSVLNDLMLKSRFIHDAEKGTYTYTGTDPYNLEDSSFYMTVNAIKRSQIAVLEKLASRLDKQSNIATLLLIKQLADEIKYNDD